MINYFVTAFSPEAPPSRYLSITGYDSDALNMFTVSLKEGRLPKSHDEIALDYNMLDYIAGKPKLGDRVSLDIGVRKNGTTKELLDSRSWSQDETFEKAGVREYTIVGLVKPGFVWTENYIGGGITYADNGKLDLNKSYNVFAKMKSVESVQKTAERIAEDLGLPKVMKGGSLKFDISYNERLLRLSAASMDAILNTSLMLTLAFIIVLIIISTIAVIYNAFNISVLERISQFGVLRCTGASPKQIKNIVIKEAWILGIIGVPLGLLSGIFAMKAVLYIIGILNYEFFTGLSVSISPEVLVLSTLLGLVTIFISAYGPARQAAKVSPLEAVRNTGGLKKEDYKKAGKSRLSKLLPGIEGQIALKNLKRNKKRFRITVFSMVISIVLYIVFGSFSDFMFKSNIVETSETGDFRVSVYRTSKEGIGSDKYNEIKNIQGVEFIYKDMVSMTGIAVPEEKINSKYAEIRPEALQDKKGGTIVLHNNIVLTYGNSSLIELNKQLKEGRIDLDTINRENGVILVQTTKIYNEKSGRFAIIDASNYKVGDKIELSLQVKDSDKGSPASVKVVAILDKGILSNVYNLNGGTIMMTSEEVYKNLTGADSFNSMFIKLDKDADREPLRKYLKELNELDEAYQYIDYSEEAKSYRDSSIALSIFLYGFVAVIALIGCLNIINTISTNLILRKRELSMMKAVGMTTGKIKKMVCLEGILYSIIASIYGSIIGAALSYVLFRILIDIRELEWSIPWNQIFIAILGAILIALISSLIPLRKINSGNIIDNIRMEE